MLQQTIQGVRINIYEKEGKVQEYKYSRKKREDRKEKVRQNRQWTKNNVQRMAEKSPTSLPNSQCGDTHVHAVYVGLATGTVITGPLPTKKRTN
jgi:hypothetical protein